MDTPKLNVQKTSNKQRIKNSKISKKQTKNNRKIQKMSNIKSPRENYRQQSKKLRSSKKKQFVMFMFGSAFYIFVVYSVYIFLLKQIKISNLLAVYSTIVFAVVSLICIRVFKSIRCFLFLLLPQVFSKQGRAAIVAYVFLLTVTGPVRNLVDNIDVMSESLSCGQVGRVTENFNVNNLNLQNPSPGTIENRIGECNWCNESSLLSLERGNQTNPPSTWENCRKGQAASFEYHEDRDWFNQDNQKRFWLVGRNCECLQ